MFDPGAIWAYVSVFCLLTAAGIGFPIPEEIPIVGAGVLVGHSSGQEVPPQIPYAAALFSAAPDGSFPANAPWVALALESNAAVIPAPQPAHWWTRSLPVRWWIMLPVCIIGVVVCDGMLYGSGRLWGAWLLQRKFMQRLVPREKRQKIEKNFHDYGVWVLLFARLMPTIRAPIFIMAGVIRLPFSRFLLADGIYAIPGVSLLFFLGYCFGEQFIQLILAFEGRVAAARPILILLLVAVVSAYLFYHFMRHPVATGDPVQEVPLIGGKVAEKLSHSEMNLAKTHDSGASKAAKPVQPSPSPSPANNKPPPSDAQATAAKPAQPSPSPSPANNRRPPGDDAQAAVGENGEAGRGKAEPPHPVANQGGVKGKSTPDKPQEPPK